MAGDVARDLFGAVVVLGQQPVVGSAHQDDVVRTVVSTQRERTAMVELEPVALGAVSPLRMDESAAAPVPFTDGTPDRRWDAARGAGEVAVGNRLPRCPARTETPRLEALQLLGHRLRDDHGQVAVRYLRPHQGSKPLQ